MEKEKLLVSSNFFFSHNVFKRCLLLMCQNGNIWSKGLKGGKHHKKKIKMFSRTFLLTVDKIWDFHIEG